MARHKNFTGVARKSDLLGFGAGSPAVDQLAGGFIGEGHGCAGQRIAAGIHLGQFHLQRAVNDGDNVVLDLANLGSHLDFIFFVQRKADIGGHGIAGGRGNFPEQEVTGGQLDLMGFRRAHPLVHLAHTSVAADAVKRQFGSGQLVGTAQRLFADHNRCDFGVGKGIGFAIRACGHGGEIIGLTGHILTDHAVRHPLPDIKIRGIPFPVQGTVGGFPFAVLGIAQHNRGRTVVLIGDPVFLDSDAAIAADVSVIDFFDGIRDYKVDEPVCLLTVEIFCDRNGNAVQRAGEGGRQGEISRSGVNVTADAAGEIDIEILVVLATLIKGDLAIGIFDVVITGAVVEQPGNVHPQIAAAPGGVLLHQAGIIQNPLCSRSHCSAVQHGGIVGIGYIGGARLIQQRLVVCVVGAALQTKQEIEGGAVPHLQGERLAVLLHLMKLIQRIIRAIDCHGDAPDIAHQVHTSVGRGIIIRIIISIFNCMCRGCCPRHAQSDQGNKPEPAQNFAHRVFFWSCHLFQCTHPSPPPSILRKRSIFSI